MITYHDMTEREQILYRALERIVAASDKRPGFVGYMNKAEMAATAQNAITAFNSDLQIEMGCEALDAILEGKY